ncbi:unnamed protein product [Zymoseptoria tritici ST99CH_3D1]|nr:unnamed protein product [Zymoseptoria tritici ST99CH_3D1]
MPPTAMRPTTSLRVESVFLPSTILTKHTTYICRTSLLPTPSPTQQRYVSSKRKLHSTSSKDVALPVPSPVSEQYHPASSKKSLETQKSILATLPLSHILRTYLITAMSSSPILLQSSTSILRRMLESKNPLFRLDSNPIMRAVLLETFYKQFCAGTNAAEIAKSTADLRQLGYSGVILEYAKEVLKDAESNELAEIAEWKTGMLKSIEMAAPGDLLGLKWSGMGPAAMNRMKDQLPPSKEMDEAMHSVCKAAAEKDMALLPAAEETWNLAGFHNWCLNLQRVYNTSGKAVVYTTYQLYLKQCPATIAEHLALAKKEGFTLGAKLVRGAYLATEKRELIWPDIQTTHNAYDAAMTALIKRQYTSSIPQPPGAPADYPSLNVVIASHNAATVTLAQKLRQEQAARGETLTPLIFAQLQGMADEVSCQLLAAAKQSKEEGTMPVERVFKCTTWGPMYECLNYLLRRAAENKDAASRTGDTRKAMGVELMRRVRAMVGLA